MDERREGGDDGRGEEREEEMMEGGEDREAGDDGRRRGEREEMMGGGEERGRR